MRHVPISRLRRGWTTTWRFAIRTSGEPHGLVEPVRRAKRRNQSRAARSSTSAQWRERTSRSLSDRRTPMILDIGFWPSRAPARGYRHLRSARVTRPAADARRSGFGWPSAATGRRISRAGVARRCGDDWSPALLAGVVGIIAMRRAMRVSFTPSHRWILESWRSPSPSWLAPPWLPVWFRLAGRHGSIPFRRSRDKRTTVSRRSVPPTRHHWIHAPNR